MEISDISDIPVIPEIPWRSIIAPQFRPLQHHRVDLSFLDNELTALFDA
jgi:hypothetical protein